MTLSDKNLTPEQELERSGWRWRAVEATRGGTTKLGTILLCAVLRQPPPRPPWFGPSCIITDTGLVVSNFVDRNNVQKGPTVVCPIQELIDNFRGLADHLRLEAADREEMFSELRKWVAVDARADPDWAGLRERAKLLH